jgi:phage-related protein
MASYTYGNLTIPVTADTKGLRADISGAASQAGHEAAGNISSSMSAGLHAVGGLAAATGKAVATGIAGATVAAAGFGVEAFKSAARASEMDAALQALAKANGITADELRKVVGAVKNQGIELGVAQGLTAQFVRSNLDLADAQKLATVAQDAAVISGRNSTEVLDDLVHGITTQNTMVLRNAGIQVNATKAQDEYAKTLGKTRGELTESEKAQATLNAVLQEGGKVAGAYKLAMEEPGKVLRSFKRVTDDIKVSVGEGLVQAFGPVIILAYDMAKALSAAVEPGGVLWPIFDALSVAVMQLIRPLEGLVKTWTEWLKNLKPEQIERVVEIIKRFGPAILVSAGALTALVAPGILSGLPVIGPALTNILGPAKLLAGGLGSVGQAALHSIPALSGIIGPAGGVGAALGGLALPVTAVVAGLAAMMLASKDFREAVFTLGRGLLDFLIPIVKALWENNLKPLLSALWQIVGAIGDALAPVIKELSKLLKPLGELFGQAAGGGAEGGGVSGLGAAIEIVLPAILGLIKVIGFVLEVLVKVIVPIAEVAIKLLTWVQAITSVLNPVKLLGTALEWLIGIVSKLWHWITGGSPGLIPAFGLLGQAASAVAGLMGGAISAAFSGLVNVVSSATSAIGGHVSESWSRMTGVISGAMSQISSTVSSGWSGMVSGAQSAGSSMVEGLKAGLSAAKGLGGWIGSNVTGPVLGFIKSGFGVFSPSSFTITIGGELLEGLKVALEKAKQLGGWLQDNVAGPVVGALKSGLDAAAMTPVGQQMIAGLQQGLSAASQMGGWLQNNVAGPILGGLKSAFGIGSPSRYTMPFGEGLIEGVEVGMDRAADHLELPALPDIGSPLAGGGFAGAGQMGGAGGPVINVYPSAGMDEQQLAAMVSRELAWATAGGIA